MLLSAMLPASVSHVQNHRLFLVPAPGANQTLHPVSETNVANYPIIAFILLEKMLK
jgi:hypothetical protein